MNELEQRIEDLEEDLEVYKAISIMHYERPYAKRYLEEQKEKIPNLMYPDSEEVYKDYYDYKTRVEKALEYIKEHTERVEINIEGQPPYYECFTGKIKEIKDILEGKE